MTLDSLPDLEYKRVVSCKDSFHGTDVLAVSEHGAPGRRPNIHTHIVGRQREDGLDTLDAWRRCESPFSCRTSARRPTGARSGTSSCVSGTGDSSQFRSSGRII